MNIIKRIFIKKVEAQKPFDKDEMFAFYEMLLKFKKKRPEMNVNRLMILIYKNHFSMEDCIRYQKKHEKSTIGL